MPSLIKYKVVIDTNVFISGILYGGNAEAILTLVRDRIVSLVISPETSVELFRKLHQFSVEDEIVEDLDILLDTHTIKVIPNRKIQRSRDPKDNMFLDVAIAGHADYLISGDKDLLVLKKIESTAIVSPKNFLMLFKPEK